MDKNSVRELSESEWRELFLKFRESNISKRAFCREEGITPTRFRFWQKRLEGNGDKDGKFIEVPQTCNILTEESERYSVELEFPGGIKLRLSN